MSQPKHTVTRQLDFDAGHRLIGHESKCRFLHGHRYKALITVCPTEELDGVGRVVDFSVIKDKVGGWIDEFWDHNMILNSDDPIFKLVEFPLGQEIVDQYGRQMLAATGLCGRTPYIMNGNPTAENMAEDLGLMSVELLKPYSIKLVRIRLYETPNCYADWYA